MKKGFILICIIFFCAGYTNAQKWLWGVQGTNFANTWPVAADNKGNVFQTGEFLDSMSFGSYHFTSLPNQGQSFLVKYDSNGNVLWVKQPLPASKASVGFSYAVAVDDSGNAYITGCFLDTVSFGSFTFMDSLSYAVFLVKYDPNGNVVWARRSTTITHLDAEANSVTTDHQGNSFITGYFIDTLAFGPDTLISIDPYNYGTAFLVKYDPNGNVVWARQAIIPSINSGSVGYSVGTDNSGNVFMTGDFTDSVSFGGIKLQDVVLYDNSVFLVKYDPNGNVLWARQSVNASDFSWAYSFAVATDASGAAYITGYFEDTVTFGNIKLSYPTYREIFLTKYDQNGNMIWAKQSAGNDSWEAYSIAIDAFNRIYISGGVPNGFSNNYIVFGKDSLSMNNTTDPSIVMELDTSGNVLCSDIVPTGAEYFNGIACSLFGKYVYFGGTKVDTVTFGPDFLSKNIGQPFVARWQPCQAPCTIDSISCTNTYAICNGSKDGTATATIYGGFSPYTYSWTGGQTTQTAIGLTGGTFTITATDASGCKISGAVNIKVWGYPTDSVCCNASIVDGQSITLNIVPSAAGNTYIWTPSSSLSCTTCPNLVATPNANTFYYVTITDSLGCKKTDSVFIEVNPECPIFVPDAFSPNNDGQNDILYVRGPCIQTMDFKVFDRWGNKVFESENINDGWDGKYLGKPMNSGTYIYYLKATRIDGSSMERKGNVALVL